MITSETYFDQWAESYTLPNDLPLFLRWNVDSILNQVPKKGEYTILDLGIGNGMLTRESHKYNPHSKLIGVDFSQGMLDESRKNVGQDVELIKSELTEVPLDSGSIDYVVSNNALHHVQDKEKLYSEIHRLLKPKGKLIYADSHDAPDVQFDEAKHVWFNLDNDFAIKYKESADTFWQALPKEIRKNHPDEYHHPFREIIDFLENARFHDVAITPSPAYFAIVSAEKQG